MSERLTHTRTTAAPSTPAARLTEVQREVVYLRSRLDEETAKNARLQLETERWHRFGGVSFGGIPIAQHWAEFVLWETLLNENPRLSTIIELGTWQGGFSWWLWAQAQARQIGFHTFDSIVPARAIPNFNRRDIFADAEALGDWFRVLEPVILFCDNGNKPRELATFSAMLNHPDTLFVVHDWGTEFHQEDVPDTVDMVDVGLCEELGSISRVFRLRGHDA